MNAFFRNVLWALAALMAVYLLWGAAASASMHYQAWRFFGELRRGQTIVDVQRIMDADRMGKSIARYQGLHQARFTIAQTWRVGTPCDDRLDVHLVFENGTLSDWYSSSGEVCM
jgi:hypothetical protein